MSDIIKTEGIVLSKLNYGDTSLIISVYTESYGKMSVIIKGARNPKGKLGMIADPLNYVQMVIYKKDTRDLQLLSSVDIISHYPRIKEDLDKTQYALAILELVKRLTLDNETNKKLFKGLVKILSLIDSAKEHPGILFGRFYFFFLSELGYALQITKCGICETEIGKRSGGYTFETGFVCVNCFESHPQLNFVSAELLAYFFCLINNRTVQNISVDLIRQANIFLDRYTKNHIPDFTGIQSLNFYNNFK
jgi:DNA repair protein RecO (recombination protein O)